MDMDIGITAYVSLFMLGFSSLFPMINPVGTALVIQRYFLGLDLASRKKYIFKIVFNSFALGFGALFVGSWCLKLMGVSTAVTQFAGGILIARMGLEMLDSKGNSSKGSDLKEDISKSLFYPIAFPLTLGPGGISVLITLSAHAHIVDDLAGTFLRMSILGLALLAVLAASYFCYVYADALIKKIGQSGSDVLSRLMSFLIFCIGLQMALYGIKKIFPNVHN